MIECIFARKTNKKKVVDEGGSAKDAPAPAGEGALGP